LHDSACLHTAAHASETLWKSQFDVMVNPLYSHHLAVSDCHLFVGFEVFTVMTMKNAVFWDIIPSLYLTGNTLQLCYRAQLVNAM
jgi:hypothetical protein